MAQQAQRQRRANAASTTVTEGPADGADGLLCSCCDPPNPLVLRPDLGQEQDGSATYALCVLHLPEPVVYRQAATGSYEPVPALRISELGELVDASGAVVARVQDEGFQRLTTVDDDDLPPEPSGGAAAAPAVGGSTATYSSTHVDLSQDEFYGSGRRAGPLSRKR